MWSVCRSPTRIRWSTKTIGVSLCGGSACRHIEADGWLAGSASIGESVDGFRMAPSTSWTLPISTRAFRGMAAPSAPLVLRAGGSFSYFFRELGQPIPLKTFQVERLSYQRADAWIAKSEYIGARTKALFHLRRGPHATLYNPVDAPACVPPFESRSDNEVVFTGTLTAKKGVMSLIEAWSAVQARVPRSELHIFGKDGTSPDGRSMKAYLRSQLPQAVRSSVHFHDHVTRTRIAAALATARVAVFPSFAEGFAWAPLEAMASGCPTIYTRIGSGPE